MVKQHFSGHAREEALDAAIRKHVPAAIEELKLHVVETPNVTNVQWTEGEPLCLQVSVEVAPTPTAKDYVKIPVVRKPVAADEVALAKRLEGLREAHARLEVAKEDAVSPTCFAVIDFTASRDGKSLPNAKGSSELVDMAAEQSVEGLTAGLLGMKRGESRTLKVKLGGKETDLAVAVKEIKVKILPPVDADFAKDLGFETVEEVKAKLKEVQDREAKSEADIDVARQIEESLIKANQFPLPPSMVERQLEGMLERMSRQFSGGGKIPEKIMADLRAKLQPKAEDEVRLAFVMSAIAEKEKIEVGDGEVQAELEAGLEKRKDQISHMIRERKTLAFLKKKASYKDA